MRCEGGGVKVGVRIDTEAVGVVGLNEYKECLRLLLRLLPGLAHSVS